MGLILFLEMNYWAVAEALVVLSMTSDPRTALLTLPVCVSVCVHLYLCACVCMRLCVCVCAPVPVCMRAHAG